MLILLSTVNVALMICLGAALLHMRHQREQIDELTAVVGDRVADVYLLGEAKAEAAELRMQLEIAKGLNVNR